MDEHSNEWNHNIGIHDITYPSNNEFHEKWIWACLDNINETHAPSRWHLIGS